MALESIAWATPHGGDIHLVPGLVSPRLDQLLAITVGGRNFRGDQPPSGVVVTWKAPFVTGGPPAGTDGVTVDTGTSTAGATGAVTVRTPLSPSPRMLDFLVVATVADASTSLDIYLRIHIHERITQVWLTPAELTVRVNAHDVRFSVLAKFEGGSYGDLSNWSPWEFDEARPNLAFVHAIASDQPVLVWESGARPAIDVNAKTGVLNCLTSSANGTISATLPGGIAIGRAKGGEPWATGATVEPLEGPGFAAMDTTPNILILGDGFLNAERQAFVDLAGLLVKELHTAPRTDPFKMLKDRISYFAAMVDSREAGISTFNPTDLTPGAPRASANDVDLAVLPADVVKKGLNIAATPAPVTHILLNERDTGFGATFGERPRAQRLHAIRSPVLSPRRVSEDDFDLFLGALKDPKDPNPTSPRPVGRHWQRGGKDSTSIVILCRSNRHGGANATRAKTPQGGSGNIICASLATNPGYQVDPAAGGRGFDIFPDPIPATPHMVASLRIAHELGHSFNLGDEYGGKGQLPTSKADDADLYANVQARVTLVDSTGRLDADKIKWGRWPRIKKAGVLTATPTPHAAGGHLLSLEAGHAADFGKGDIVRLRTRPLPNSVQSERLEVTREKVGPDELHVVPVGPPLVAGTFPAGSIVMEPKRAPDMGGTKGGDLSLVHSDVRDFIDEQQNPLNAAFTAPSDRPCRPDGVYVPPERVYKYSTPAVKYGPGNAPNPPKESAWIAGLFEKGMAFDCGVYHPTGACLMNVYSYDEFVHSFQFCWICRYAMVDAVDPTAHGLVDDSYASRYPT